MRKLPIALAALLAHAAGCQSEGETRRENVMLRADPAPEIARMWLLRDCATESLADLRLQMMQVDDQLRPIFLDAMQNGPPQTLLVSYEEKARARHAEMRAFLRDGPDLGLPPDLRRHLDAETSDLYWDRARSDLIEVYRARAVLGLGVIGGPGVPELLQGLTQSDGPLSLPARYALAHPGG